MYEHIDRQGVLGVDIGGSHISAAWVDAGAVLEETFYRSRIDAGGSAPEVIRGWAAAIRGCMDKLPARSPRGIGIAMPGPFDYARGVSLIEGVHKYERLLGLNVREALLDELGMDIPLLLENDAACFGLGEYHNGKAAGASRVLALTLGTGLGSVFIRDGRICGDGPDVPPGGFLYAVPFKEGIAEDYISTRGLLGAYVQRTGVGLDNVEALAARALTGKDPAALSVFSAFGMHLGHVLEPWVQAFRPDCVVLGGAIRKASDFFLPSLQSILSVAGLQTPIYLSDRIEFAALEGAASLLADGRAAMGHTEPGSAPGSESAADPAPGIPAPWRKTTQPLMPVCAETPPGAYDRYPFHALGDGHISRGYEGLAAWIATHPRVLIDGYAGNDWDAIRAHLGAALRKQGKRVAWFETAPFLKDTPAVIDLTAPFMGEAGSVWGKVTDLELTDFFRMDSLERVQSDFDLSIGLGIGAALLPWDAPVLYIDLPKNEIQYRMRAGSTVNLGFSAPLVPTEMYKRYYFIDWVVLDRHRKRIKERIVTVADGQWRDDITWAGMDAVRGGLRQMASSTIRVRPWFEAGAWGGQWLKNHIPGLPREEVNYAWSFELIVPENGLVLESAGLLLEIAFDWLMEQEAAAVLGIDVRRFGTAFPIRFDFLDTFDGGNLSIQCHPTLPYIREQFGERITQDETYYILDCAEDAGVYLGFQADIDPVAFREVLETSHATGEPVDIDRYVQRHTASRHDLFLIPNSTIHSAGKNNLVLEISATPYIYTFKMYDWLRLDLNGEPRPINIGHAFRNLDFDRRGDRVTRELLSRPHVLDRTEHYRLVHLPTHPVHFYDVHRLEFTGSVTVSTADQCHVLMVVEGASVWVETPSAGKKLFYYAETFVVPAAAGSYRLHTEDGIAVKVVKAFIKPDTRTT